MKRANQKNQVLGALKTTMSVLSVLVVSAGCGKLKEMKDNTVQANKNSTRILSLNEAMLPVSRQGGASGTRRDTFEKVVEAEDMGSKISWAAHYFNALEFQTWMGTQLDTRTRDELIGEGVREVFQLIGGIAPATRDMNRSISPGSGGNERQTLMAMAATMHQVNGNQRALTDTDTSMYDIIKEALAIKQEIEAGMMDEVDPRIKPYHRDVLSNYNLAVYMLQLRYNFLVSLSLNKIADISKFTTLGKFRRAYLSRLPLVGDLFDWTPDTHLRTPEELQTAVGILNGAVKTEVSMVAVGVAPRLDRRLRLLVEGMNRPQDINADNARDEFQRERTIRHNELKNKYMEILDELVIRRATR